MHGVALAPFHIFGDHIEEVIYVLAVFDGQRAVHITFTGLQVWLEKQLPGNTAVMKANGDLRRWRTNKAMFGARGINDMKCALADQFFQEKGQ